jgi:hypothetical protein
MICPNTGSQCTMFGFCDKMFDGVVICHQQSVGNRSVKRVGRKRSAVLASLVILALGGLVFTICYFLLFEWILVIFVIGILGSLGIYAVVSVWRFFFGLFIDKFFS